jgi:hypothetical protein
MIAIDGTQGSIQIRAAIIEQIDFSQWEEAHPVAAFSGAPRVSPSDIPTIVIRDHCLEGLGAYRSPNWDANDAAEISDEVFGLTKSVLDILPISIPDPDVTPAANGSLCMEWTVGNNFFWADVEPDGKLLTLLKVNGARKETSYDIRAETALRQHLALALNRLYL